MKVIIMCAVSLDGKIARGKNDPIDWTSRQDKKNFAQQTKKAGVVIMGHNTFKSIGHPLKDRFNLVLTSQPLAQVGQKGQLEFTDQKPAQLLRNLSRRGFKKVFVIGGSKINSLFLKENLVTEIWLTLVPIIFGQGISLFDTMLEKKLRLVSLKKLSYGLLFLKYHLAKR